MVKLLKNTPSKKSSEMSNIALQISLPVDIGFVVVHYSDLIYIQADGNFSKVFLADDKQLLITRHLKAFEKFLPDDFFLRIHNKYIVNKAFVKAFNKKDMQVILSTATRLPVSVRRKKALYNSFKPLTSLSNKNNE